LSVFSVQQTLAGVCRLQLCLTVALFSCVCVAQDSSGIGSVGFDTMSYFGPVHSDEQAFFSTFKARWRGKKEGDVFETGIQGELTLTLNRMSSYFADLPAVYVGTSENFSPVKLSVGRRLVEWNKLDKHWALGIWEPCSRWDQLYPGEVGLAGAFLSVDQPMFQLVAFGSPVFIPERGAITDVENGRVQTSTPWLLKPPEYSNGIGRKPTRIDYTLSLPPMRDIILNSGAAVKGRVGAKEGLWGAMGYAYTPINQLLIGYNGYYLHTTKAIDATLYPRILYHHLASIEAGYENKRVAGWISVLGERPERDKTLEGWTTQEISPALAMCSTLGVNFSGRERFATKLDLSYLRAWGADAPDAGSFASGVSTFDSRYPFKNAVKVSFETPLWVRSLKGASRMLYDIEHAGSIVSAELLYQPRDSWSLGVGTDIISSDQPLDAYGHDDFISKYRSNDRVRGGISYAF
jgi:hypothetical protein